MRMAKSALIGALMVMNAASAQASDRDWGRASGIVRNALVVGALGVPALRSDWPGVLQAGGSTVAAFGAAQGLKAAFPERRPDGSDRKSFPSAHAASAFAAAASLHNRYGWEIGLPAQIAAAFVGVARVKARKHHWHDVAVGAAIGEASGLLITSRHDDAVRVLPWGDANGGGMAMALRF